MSECAFNILGVIFVVVLWALVVIAVTAASVETAWQKRAIIHKAAHYDAQTGAFKWNEEP